MLCCPMSIVVKDAQDNDRLAQAPGKHVVLRQRLVGPFPPHSGRPRTPRPDQQAIQLLAARMPIAAAVRICSEGGAQVSAADGKRRLSRLWKRRAARSGSDCGLHAFPGNAG